MKLYSYITPLITVDPLAESQHFQQIDAKSIKYLFDSFIVKNVVGSGFILLSAIASLLCDSYI